jgi:hypothetical protein
MTKTWHSESAPTERVTAVQNFPSMTAARAWGTGACFPGALARARQHPAQGPSEPRPAQERRDASGLFSVDQSQEPKGA